MTNEERLKKALDLAVGMLSQHEPKDSRMVSDEFVALAAIQSGAMQDEKALATIDAILDTALARMETVMDHLERVETKPAKPVTSKPVIRP